jgi:hypothetical protein
MSKTLTRYELFALVWSKPKPEFTRGSLYEPLGFYTEILAKWAPKNNTMKE